MNHNFDVIIVGLGAIGSSVAFHLSQRNKKVLGIDRFIPPHEFGSSHGQTRIIREAYFEHPQYVPIIQKAFQNWEKLECDYGKQLYLQTGGAMIGDPGSEVVKGARLSAQMHHLPHEILNAKEIQKKFTVFQPHPEMIAVFEPRAGILFPEKCIQANLDLAGRQGAVFHFNEPAISWKANHKSVTVKTSTNEYHATHLLLTPGAWLPELVPELQLPLTVTRQVLFWFEPLAVSIFERGHCPIYIWSYENNRIFYGFPDLGRGVKVARHYEGERTEPGSVRRDISEDEVQSMRTVLQQFLPAANGKLLDATVCLYTNTPDSHFLISYHPFYPQVLIASICSGHGFKFASAFGEILSDLLLEKKSSFDLSLFMTKK